MIAIILLQKTGSDSLAGLSGGGNNLFSSKSSMGLLSKITIFLTICFILNSLLIAKVINNQYKHSSKIINSILDDTNIDKRLEVPENVE